MEPDLVSVVASRQADVDGDDERRIRAFTRAGVPAAAFVCIVGWLGCWYAGCAWLWILGPVLMYLGEDLLIISTHLACLQGRVQLLPRRRIVTAILAATVGAWLCLVGAPPISLGILPCFTTALVSLLRRVYGHAPAAPWVPAITMAVGVAMGETVGHLLACAVRLLS